MFQAVFLDLDDTLIDREAAFERYARDFLARFQRPDEAAVELIGLDGAGYASRDSFCRGVAERFPELSLDPEAVWRDFSSRLAGFVPFREPVVRLVERLAGRYQLAVVSNGSGAMQREKMRRAGLAELVPDVFISGEVGAEKPDPAIFHAALERTGCEPARVLFVGDDLDRDVRGASTVGMSTCWVDRGRDLPPGSRGPTCRVRRAVDLEGILLA